MRSKSLVCKLFALILVTIVIVSLNLAAATTFNQINNRGNPNPSQGTQSAATNRALEALSQSDYNWTATALSTYVDDTGKLEVIVGVDNSASSYNTIAALTNQNGGKITSQLHMGSQNALVIELSASAASHLIDQIHSSGVSSYIEPNGKYYVDSTANDPYYNLQWGLRRVNADAAWNTTIGSNNLLVAVIDTGVDYTHPDLKANYVPFGYDFVNNDNDPLDDHGHGTHCAGIIAATLNNSLGVAGVAQVKIMAEKGLNVNGSGSYVDLARCIIHATDVGAKILSNSWGGSYSALVEYAVAYATAHGALVIAASGNENTSQPLYPGALDDVIAVAATNTTDTRASFSNYGNWVDVAAPGVMIYSTTPTYNVTMYAQPRFTQNYSYMNGTSMACPMAAGVAALIWSKYPTMTAEFVRAQLESTCDDVGEPGFDQYFGYGIVDAQRGVEQSPTLHDLAAKSWVKPSYVMQGTAQSFSLAVINRGLLDEANVHVSLIVNGVAVNSTTIASLKAYTTASTVLTWTPSATGTYNVTYAVAPSSGETNLNNNQLSTTYTIVASPDSSNWTQIATNPDTNTGCNLKAAYSQLHDGTVFFKATYYHPWSSASIDIDTGIMIDADQNVSTGMPLDFYYNQEDFIGADCMILVGREGNEVWIWNQTTRGWDTSNPINILYLDAQDNSSVFVVGVSADNLHLTGAFDCSLNDIIPIGEDDAAWDWMPDYGYVPFVSQVTQYNLAVTLDTLGIYEPNVNYTLTANVHNIGQANQSNITLQLIIEGQVVNSTSIAALSSGQITSVTYNWRATEGHDNITAYAASTANESNASNNVRTRSVSVFQKIAVISDTTELWTTLNVLDAMGINYDYYSNNDDLYTAQSSILNTYPVVIYYNNARNITTTEAAALNSYLAHGGMLLVTGLDSTIYNNSKLANIVRVISSGDDFKENDLTVVNASHPIMNGQYGHFEAGYNVTGLNIDNDAILADTSRNATTLAQLTDGNAKIVVTDSLPGKVVYWNGIGTDDWLNNPDCEAMFKNTLLWFLDVSAPSTTADYNGAWHNADFTVTLSAYDYFGVNQTYYKVNGGEAKTVAADGQPVISTESANNTLEYWSTDLSDHVEVHQFLQGIKLDKTPPAASFTINTGAKYTNTKDITLTLNITDAFPVLMRFSNDNANWTTWINYTAQQTWTLTSGDGHKTVYAQFQDEAGLAATANSSIILDTTAPIANTGSSQTVNLGDTVAFSGSASSDANGIISYRWNFGDGTQATGVSASNVYGSIGTFTVRLTVQDAAGNTASATTTVVVNIRPAATTTPTQTPTVTPTPTQQPTITPTPEATTTQPTPTQPPTTMYADNSQFLFSGIAVVSAIICLLAVAVLLIRLQRKK